ncbi:MAG TPA: hypothetical protein VMZ25_07495 [Terriglobales bacterium]|nr:hypothetical protein [Terriglobales bacterium]
MPAHLCEIAGGLVAAIVCEGDVTGSDFTEATRELLRWDDARLRKLAAGLVDQTNAAAFNVEPARVQALVDLDIQLAQKVRRGLLVAVAAPGDLQYGMSRMWQSLADVTGFEIMVFRNHALAMTWLRSRASQKFGVELPSA